MIAAEWEICFLATNQQVKCEIEQLDAIVRDKWQEQARDPYGAHKFRTPHELRVITGPDLWYEPRLGSYTTPRRSLRSELQLAAFLNLPDHRDVNQIEKNLIGFKGT